MDAQALRDDASVAVGPPGRRRRRDLQRNRRRVGVERARERHREAPAARNAPCSHAVHAERDASAEGNVVPHRYRQALDDVGGIGALGVREHAHLAGHLDPERLRRRDAHVRERHRGGRVQRDDELERLADRRTGLAGRDRGIDPHRLHFLLLEETQRAEARAHPSHLLLHLADLPLHVVEDVLGAGLLRDEQRGKEREAGKRANDAPEKPEGERERG